MIIISKSSKPSYWANAMTGPVSDVNTKGLSVAWGIVNEMKHKYLKQLKDQVKYVMSKQLTGY